MSNNYSQNQNPNSRQFAAAYATYMMVGSLFQKCSCTNPIEETHLLLHYKGLPEKKQISLEDHALEQIHRLEVGTEELMHAMRCKAFFERKDDSYSIRFWTGGFEEIVASISLDGKIQLKIA